MNKKADMASIFVYGFLILFGLAIGGMIMSKMITDVTDNLSTVEDLSNDTAQVAITKAHDRAPVYLDYLFLIAFVAGVLGLVISSIFVDSHPAFFVAFFVMLVIGGILGNIFSNIVTEVGESTSLSSTWSNFTFTSWIMNNFVFIIIVVSIIVAIILYNKWQGGSAGI